MNQQAMEAFNKWSSLSNEKCFCKAHANSKFETDGFLIKPAPFDEVCEREKAWRTYVELRDSRPEGWASKVYLRRYKDELDL